MTEEEELAALRKLLAEVAVELRAAAGDEQEQERVIRRYIAEAYPIVLSPLDLWDYFCISSPGVVGNAGYTGPARDSVIDVYERVSRSVFSR